ncbi:MAG: hemerythrin [Geobacteraceae bacterium GWC2_58_44]|nr:MAG: hemerythrin [Geobacteraceae bacterium GWC2_58_44]HBG06424.1 hemerythrin [Geobacter sp.]
MPIIEWNVSYLLGIHEIDQHHEHLVQLINKAYDQFRCGADIEPSFVDELVDYAGMHFACEEGWMTESSYPKFVEHKEEHKLFNCRILELQNKSKTSSGISVELLWFLCNWVTHHMRETDAEFGRYVDLRNIRKRTGRIQASNR